MKQSEKYLMQSASFYTMLAWMEQQKERGINCVFENNTLYLPTIASKYFAVAISRYKKHKYPFLCIQPNENSWMKNIIWDYVAIREDDIHLYLVAKYIEGDGFSCGDLHPFAVAIKFDMKEKLEALMEFSKMDAREYFIDTDDTVRINYHSKIFNLDIKVFKEHEPYIADVTDYILYEEEKRAEQNKSLIQRYDGIIPDFKGTVNINEEAKGLREKYK